MNQMLNQPSMPPPIHPVTKLIEKKQDAKDKQTKNVRTEQTSQLQTRQLDLETLSLLSRNQDPRDLLRS